MVQLLVPLLVLLYGERFAAAAGSSRLLVLGACLGMITQVALNVCCWSGVRFLPRGLPCRSCSSWRRAPGVVLLATSLEQAVPWVVLTRRRRP